MEIIARNTDSAMAAMLDGYEYPAILVTADYQILATNDLYKKSFGVIDHATPAYCYRVSHGFEAPCDQSGEDCPLAATLRSGKRERVLHIHQTPRGREHVDVELLPIHDAQGRLNYFVELLKTVPMVGAQAGDQEMVGTSPTFNRMIELIARVGPTDASVLLLGESGTGKELAARAIHLASGHKDKPLVTLECAGLTESLFESELFGHVRGAFTGANYAKQGLVEAAHGGTLFLDEIGDVPLTLQVKLLRLLETGTYRPVGSTQIKTADFRLVCATHKDIAAMVDEARFRQDLYFRINVFPIRIPSLEDRRDDIPLIAKSLLQRLNKKNIDYCLTESAIARLKTAHYKGNIRELRNILARALVLANTNVIDQHVIAECLDDDATETSLGVDLKTLEQTYIKRLLQEQQGDKVRVAQIAGISLRSLYRKIQEFQGPREINSP